ncbi:hypothetical protein SAMN00777080_1183 [Aquiflexum balticum DSM 16537]|uniref:Uncharacterized protein n=2 Tax=Aquiflexum TaxID=280472 RepID=A0A1W2H1X9_9BACT|nr:hypothetical protein SAMN00777080_1183 [Aquiflexum balticum DSM 16537]
MNLIREVYRRSPKLGWFGTINFLLLFFMLCISFFDERILFGISVWFKPMKFAISIGVFAWTIAWFLYELPQKHKVNKIEWVIILMLSIEQVIIIGQAARGEMSHFNISSLFNGILFQIMGIAILINTIMVFWAFLLFRIVDTLPSGYKIGIQFGMLIFIVASLEGYLMAANLGHTVGAPDGQEGVFFLNWAKSYGDLRIFHFLGLHALQVLPLFAWYFSRDKSIPVIVFGTIYFLLSLGTLWNALAGRGISMIS